MRGKKAKTKEENLVKRYQDLLDIARVVSWCTDRDYLIKTCLDHISQRLEKRARCVLMEEEELRLHCWVGRYEGPIEQVPIEKRSLHMPGHRDWAGDRLGCKKGVPHGKNV